MAKRFMALVCVALCAALFLDACQSGGMRLDMDFTGGEGPLTEERRFTVAEAVDIVELDVSIKAREAQGEIDIIRWGDGSVLGQGWVNGPEEGEWEDGFIIPVGPLEPGEEYVVRFTGEVRGSLHIRIESDSRAVNEVEPGRGGEYR